MRVPRTRAAFLLLLLATAPAGAQQVVTSAAPDNVAVTVYRATNRSADDQLDLDWLQGYALISETRQVTLPAGETELRFEGVAGGIIPQSAIVRGLPDGIVERNRDAMLLSPDTLLARSLGRRVHLQRTSLATGAVTEQEAVVRSGAGGGVVLQTPDGFEALRCAGLSETIRYDGVPAGLSARPTLSVRARTIAPATATVTLTYLANGFDWQANYVASLSEDGSRVNLFAWLTLANGDETGFANASTQAVAGRLNREEVEVGEPEGGPLRLLCWPQGRTHEIPMEQIERQLRARFAQQDTNMGEVLNELPQALRSEASQIVVTGSRAVQEALGDLKLYRIPEPVTVAARSQKQVAFLEQPSVQVSFVYRNRFDPDGTISPEQANLYLLTRNRREEGLGLPLPAGGVQLFAEGAGRPILLGEGTLRDRAIGEDVEVRFGQVPSVHVTVVEDDEEEDGGNEDHYLMTVTNDRPVPVNYEVEFRPQEGARLRPRGARLGRRDGQPLWQVTVPSGGSATLRYRVTRPDED
jgi:hypothetical protein